MLKQTMKLWVAVAALAVAAPAQAMTFQLGITVDTAVGGNALGAVVGTTNNAGTANIGSQVVTGVGGEFPSLNENFDPAADLALTIGTILFGDEDDIESGAATDIPSMIFDNGVFQGLDYVILFEISGGQAIGKPFDETDLGQDTSAFTNTQHYWADFDDSGGFVIGTVTGFDEFFDEEDLETLLGPTIGQFIVTGQVFTVPEPSLAMMAGAGLLGLALLRRRS